MNRIFPLSIFVILISLQVSSVCYGQGIALRGVGSINESMAGASVAAPIDSAGSIHWNPASISEFQNNEMTMGLGLVLPDTEVSSSIAGFSGTSSGESGVSPIPTLALVHKTANPRVTFGLGAYAIAGFKVNYDSSMQNPVLFQQGSLGAIPSFGRVNTEAEFFQIALTMSIALTDRISIGAAPTLTMGRLAINPLFAAPPAGGVYPESSGSRYHFGGGAQFGVYFAPNTNWRFGASLKTTQWMEEFRFKYGNGGRSTAKFDYPMIVSVGTSYSGIPGVLWAVDVRYFDYENTDGFGDSGFNPDGSLAGTGWRSTYSVATGIQKHLNCRTSIRIGHVYNTNPVQDDQLLVNLAAPLITQHISSVGLSYSMTQQLTANIAYLHAWENSQQGPYVGVVPGSTIEISTAAELVSCSLTVKW